MKSGKFWIYLYAGGIGVAAFALLVWLTPFGPGVNADSITYIRAAKSLSSGNGFSVDGSPITHYPPLYPLFLAAASSLDNNPVETARLLNAVLLGVNAALVALTVYFTAGRNFITTTFASIFFLSSAAFIELYSMAWSEPLFITFSLACIIFLCLYVMRPTIFLIIASALFLGLAIVTRYIGVAFLPPALVMIFLERTRQTGRRIRNAVAYIIFACAPIGFLVIRNMLVAGSATNRSFVFHPISIPLFTTEFIFTIFNFIAPFTFPAFVKAAIFGLLGIILIALLVISFKRHTGDINWRLTDTVMPLSSVMFILSYTIFLFLSISFLDAHTPVDSRILSPILTIAIPGLFSAVWVLSRALKQDKVLWCFLLLIALSISIKVPDAFRFAADIQSDGLAFTSREWQNSESIAFIRLLEEDVKIYSNGADVIHFYTDKPSEFIPENRSPNTDQVNIHYNQEIEIMCREIRENRALLVYFNRIDWRGYLPAQADLQGICPMQVLRHFMDGTIYGEKP